MSYTIALTGATGFIGSIIARQLADIGWQIRALTRRTSNRSRLQGVEAHWVAGALEDGESLCRLVRGADAVVHCAGAVRGANQTHFKRLNVDSVARLVHAAIKQHPLPRFLYISSLAAREPHLSHYAASKRQAEAVLKKTAGKMLWVVLRPPAVYGPGDREILPLFQWMVRGIAPVLSSGNARFSLLYVEDLAEAVQQVVSSEQLTEKVFELHDGHPDGYSWQDLIDAVAHLYARKVRCLHVPVGILHSLARLNLMAAHVFGYAPMLTPGKIRELRHPNWVCENEKLTREIGWVPRVTLEEGLRRTLGIH
jgi:nucleoside-diphosphate-sugar epimerase